MTSTSGWGDYQVPKIMIETGDGTKRPVRGLSTEDIGLLLVSHLDAMMELTTLFIATQKDVLAKGNFTDLLVLASRSFPNLVTEVISIVTDEPKLIDMRLPAPLQLQIIQAAYKLTVEDVGGMGNLSAMLSNAVRAAVAGRGAASQKLQDILSQSSIGDAVTT